MTGANIHCGAEGENADFYIYVNGEKHIDNGWISYDYWVGFLNTIKNSKLNCLDIGRCQMGDKRSWNYLIGDVYTLRLYNRSLTDEEVMENYNKTVSYSLGQ